MPKDTGKKLADMLYGQPFDVPTPENLRLGQKLIEQQVREKAARDAKLTPLDKAKAAYEAAKMMGSAAVAGLGSIPTRIAYGPEAAENYIASRISIPTTEKGLDYVENVGNFLEQLETKYKLPPIMPEAMVLQNLTGPATKQATRAAKQKVMQAGKAGERLAERKVPQIMERGGAGADILSGMAQGSRSNVITKKPEPFVVAHGSNDVFDQFKSGQGITAKHIYTTPENLSEDAAKYGSILYKAQATPKNIIDFSDESKLDKPTLNALKKAAKDAGIIDKYHTFDDLMQNIMDGQLYQAYGGQRTQNALLDELFAKYDAVKMPDATSGGGLSKSVVFKNPENLKILERKNEGGSVHISDNPDVMQLELAGGGLVKGLAKAVGKAAEAAGQKAPVLAEKELTTLQDTHTMLGDRVRAGVMDAQKMMEGFDYKYDKGQRVFTKDSAGKNKPPYTILNRTRVGNQVMREDHPEFGPGMGRPIIDPETGKAMRTPYEPGYRVRMERGPDDWSEFEIPQSAIAGDVEMAAGGAVSYAEGGEITADDLILEERKL